MTNLQHLYETEGDYKKRLEPLLEEIKKWITEHGGDCTFSNGQLTALLSEAHGVELAARKRLSRDISSAGRLPEAKLWVRPGPEKKVYGDMTRTRVWAAPGSPEGKGYVDPAFERLRGARHKELTKDDIYACARHLRAAGWITVSPAQQERGETVQSVDKGKISRHPKPGYKPATCGECGGIGKVFMKGP